MKTDLNGLAICQKLGAIFSNDFSQKDETKGYRLAPSEPEVMGGSGTVPGVPPTGGSVGPVPGATELGRGGGASPSGTDSVRKVLPL